MVHGASALNHVEVGYKKGNAPMRILTAVDHMAIAVNHMPIAVNHMAIAVNHTVQTTESRQDVATPIAVQVEIMVTAVSCLLPLRFILWC